MSRLGSRHRLTYFLLDRLAILSGLTLACLFPMVALRAQETPVVPQSSTATSPESGSPPNSQIRGDKRYIIGVGDVLDIRVFGRPQLTRDAVRVDDRGKIRMPLLQDEIQASCRTERELAADIGTRYLKYVRRPQVDVFIREYNSQPVAVVGAVHTPGRFQLQRPVANILESFRYYVVFSRHAMRHRREDSGIRLIRNRPDSAPYLCLFVQSPQYWPDERNRLNFSGRSL